MERFAIRFAILSATYWGPRLIHGLCWLGDTLASLMRVHNQLETIIPLGMCCCSQEWRTTNMSHSQVSCACKTCLWYWTCDWLELVVRPKHNHRYKLVARPLGMWPQHTRPVFRRERPDGDFIGHDQLVARRSSWNVTGAIANLSTTCDL